jgi:hypothetical protein
MSKELREKIKEAEVAFKKSKEDFTNSYIDVFKWEYSQVKKLISSVDKLIIMVDINSDDEGGIITDYSLYLKENYILDDFDFEDIECLNAFGKDDKKSFKKFVDSFYELTYDASQNHLDIVKILKKSGFKIEDEE